MVCIVVLTVLAIVMKLGVRRVGDLGNLPDILPVFLWPQVPLNFQTLAIIFPYSISLAVVGLLESLMTAQIVDDLTDTPSIYQHAAWAAARTGSSIHVLHVIERNESLDKQDLSGSIGFDANAELLEELAKHDESHARVARLRGKAILEDAMKQLAGHEVKTTQRHGSVVETLDEFEKGAELVVIGKRGEHADFAKGHLGSNLERVIRSARIPVLVATREFKPITRFLIAFDGGSSAHKAVQHAATHPLLKGLDCHLLMVGKLDKERQLSLEHAGIERVTLGAYAYLMEFRDKSNWDNNTFGASAKGDALGLTLYGELAWQDKAGFAAARKVFHPSTRDVRFNHRGDARKIRSDDPAPTMMLQGFTPRAVAMDSTSPSQPVGGDVRSSHGRFSTSALNTAGAGGNQASRTSALIIPGTV